MIADAVAEFNSKQGSRVQLFVLVDEYDAPVRSSLIASVGAVDGTQKWTSLTSFMAHYCSFFASCKSITSPHSQTKTFVWLTGVTPIALESISGFVPNNITFNPNFANT